MATQSWYQEVCATLASDSSESLRVVLVMQDLFPGAANSPASSIDFKPQRRYHYAWSTRGCIMNMGPGYGPRLDFA